MLVIAIAIIIIIIIIEMIDACCLDLRSLGFLLAPQKRRENVARRHILIWI